jgi:CRISPR-associated protein Cas1
MKIARNILIGKLYNGKWVLERAVRDYPLRVDVERIKQASQFISNSIIAVKNSITLLELFGIEGEAATHYFSVFDELILNDKNNFYFNRRSKRPPLDKVNALMSFMYTILANDISAALSSAGLDPFVGFIHRDRPGRRSLALDLLEELRAPIADRFILTLINTKQIKSNDFIVKESGAVILRDDARKTFLSAWQTRKRESLEHPFLNEKIEIGLIPHVQALLLARYLRGDLDEYPPFMWK